MTERNEQWYDTVRALEDDLPRIADGERRSWNYAAEKLADLGYRKVGADERHKINFKQDGWVIMHPLSCRPNLFECPFNEAAADIGDVIGLFYCELDEAGELIIGGMVE